MDFYTLIKVLAAQLLMPVPLFIVLLCLGLVLYGRCRRLGNGVMMFAVMWLVLLSWGPVADRLLVAFESRYDALHDWPTELAVPAVMVLGGGYQPNRPWVITGQLSDSSANRLLEGLRLWHLNPEAMLLVSGASRQSDVEPMARAYGRIALDMGVAPRQLQVLDTPTDTAAEAQAARAVLGQQQTLLLVTSASHMPRAMRHFQRAGLKPIAAPTHYLAQREAANTLGYWIPSARHLRKSERAFYEALAMLAVRWE